MERLAFTKPEVQKIFDCSATTLWRLERKNLIRRVPGLGHAIYAKSEVERFLSGKAATK